MNNADHAAEPRELTADEMFDPERLMRGAEAETSQSDWGDTDFVDGLEMLCRALREDHNRSASAVSIFGAELTKLLKLRLGLAAARKEHPEIAQQRVVAPLIVLGLPRSGTTILHSILSADPTVRSPHKWELDDPFPPPRTETFLTDPRIAVAEAAVAQLSPTFRAMHQVGAQLPLECNTIQRGSFRTCDFAALIGIPSYHHWLINEAEMAPSYAFHTQFLQHLQAFANKDHWVLKGPTHMYWPEQLLKAYPDARIVMTHRDPVQIMASSLSLITHIREMIEPANIAEITHEQGTWSEAVRRMLAFRDGWHDPHQFCDVQYKDFMADPLGVVRGIYAHFNMDLSSDAETAMRTFIADNAQEKHGKHQYAAADYGLDTAAVRRDFASYINRFCLEANR